MSSTATEPAGRVLRTHTGNRTHFLPTGHQVTACSARPTVACPAGTEVTCPACSREMERLEGQTTETIPADFPTWNWTTYKQVPAGATVITAPRCIWRNRAAAEAEVHNPRYRFEMVAYGQRDFVNTYEGPNQGNTYQAAAAVVRNLEDEEGTEVVEERPGSKKVLWTADA